MTTKSISLGCFAGTDCANSADEQIAMMSVAVKSEYFLTGPASRSDNFCSAVTTPPKLALALLGFPWRGFHVGKSPELVRSVTKASSELSTAITERASKPLLPAR